MKKTLQLKLIVGLGNPGPQYSTTRHNAGAWFVQKLAERYNITLRPETKFKGLYGNINLENRDCKLLIPHTYMNCSGEAVSAVTNFFKIPPAIILIAHDELDFPPGTIKIKFDGGDNGHNGIKSIVRHLKSSDFYRLRIGIGKFHDKSTNINYVLTSPSKHEQNLMDDSLQKAIDLFPELISGNIANFMQALHTNN